MNPTAFVIPIVGLFGAIVGSFLNVVIYRLPRGLSVNKPSRSFCPVCRTPIRAHHNIPVLSWLWLRGQCAACGTPIPLRYPIVEASCAIIFVTVWDQLFVARSLPGVLSLPHDWPLELGYFTLFATLLAASVMDIDTYTIDIRVCVAAMVAGLIAHIARGMPSALTAPTPPGALGMLPPALCLIGASMGAAWLATVVVVSWMTGRNRTSEVSEPQEEEILEDAPATRAGVASTSRKWKNPLAPVPVLLLTVVLVALIVWQIVAPNRPIGAFVSAGNLRALLAFGVFMFMLILAGWAPREVDEEIAEEIESARPQARRLALRELGWFLPAIAVGVGMFLVFRSRGVLAISWMDALDKLPISRSLADHVGGSIHALGALVWAAALGWSVRILGTLAFGKEAYGTGDIYLMASIGAVAGVWNCFFGFFAAALLALVGVLATVFRRAQRAIPFGPWLALGSFLMLGLQRPLLGYFTPAGTVLWGLISGQSGP